MGVVKRIGKIICKKNVDFCKQKGKVTEWFKVLIWNVSFVEQTRVRIPPFPFFEVGGTRTLTILSLVFETNASTNFATTSYGYCIVVVPLPSKQEARVRFSLSVFKRYQLWDELDSNQRRQSQWIYNPSLLTSQASSQTPQLLG